MPDRPHTADCDCVRGHINNGTWTFETPTQERALTDEDIRGLLRGIAKGVLVLSTLAQWYEDEARAIRLLSQRDLTA